MIGNQRASLKALMSEKINPIDTIDTYEKRVKPLTMGIANADILPYLFDHLFPRIETRMRIINPNTVDAFFTQLRIIWLESGGATGNFNRDIENQQNWQIPQKNIALENFANIAQRLGYTGDLTDPIAIHNFVETDLTNKLGVQSNNIKKVPFGYSNNTSISRKVYNTKKPTSKITFKCGECGKIGYKKNYCPKKKRTKKVNYDSIN